MKFAMTRAWKDETYCESLSNEQLNTLSTNPVEELSDAELDAVFGGFCGGGFAFNKVYQHNESVGLICEVNIFSVSALISNIALLGSVSQICVKG